MTPTDAHEWPAHDDVLRDLDRVCDRFEAAWKGVPPSPEPRLEEYLPEQPAQRLAYFRELLAVEVYHRRRAGLPIDRDDYLGRFPSMAGVIAMKCEAADAADRAVARDGSHMGLERALLGSGLLAVPKGETTDDAGRAVRRDVAAVLVPGYEVGQLLGRGGMGAVFLARQVAFDRTVALKVILAGGAASESERARFRTEALAAARLNHAGIVQVYEAGEGVTDAGARVPFLAMEFCPGGSLSAKLGGNPLPPAEAADLLERLARAVHAAHEANVVHRDLKPHNVLIAAGGLPKVGDFGLAKLLGDAGQTHSAAVLGTPAYMAPEQANDIKLAGPAADVYGLGAILYECLTGRPPFQAPTALDVLVLARNADPLPPRQLQPGVPRDLETVCLKCLRKEPARRYPSAEALAEDLRRFRAHEPILARPVGPAEKAVKWAARHRALAGLYAVSAVAAALLLGLGFWFSARVGAERSKADAEAARREAADASEQAARSQAQAEKLLGLASKARARIARPRPGWRWAALDLIGQAAALPANDEVRAELRSDAAECLTSIDVRLTGAVGEGLQVWSLAWSPDGKTLAVGQRAVNLVFARYPVTLLGTGGDAPRELLAPQNVVAGGVGLTQDAPNLLGYSPDGRWLAAGSRSGWVHCWDLAGPGGAPAWSHMGHDKEVGGLAFSKDGRSLFTGGGKTVRRYEAATGRRVAEFDAGERVSGLAVHPEDGWVAVSAGKLYRLNASTLRPLAPDIAFTCGQIAFAPESDTLLCVRGGEVFVLPLDSRGVQRTISAAKAAGEVMSMALAAGGALLLTASGDRHARLWDAVSGRVVAELPFDDGRGRTAFAPGGRAFAVSDEKRVRLYEVGGLREQTFAAVRPEHPVQGFCLSPDGRTMAAAAGHNGPWSKLCTWGTGVGSPRLGSGLFERGEDDRLRLSSSPRGALAVVPREGLAEIGHERGPASASARVPVTGVNDVGHDGQGRLWLAEGQVVRVWGEDGLPLGGREICALAAHLCAPGGAPLRPALCCPLLAEQSGRWTHAHRGGLGVLLTGKPGVNCLAPGRRWTAAGCRDGSLMLLEVMEGRVRQRVLGGLARAELNGVALSHDESLVVAGTGTGELIVAGLPGVEKRSSAQAHDDAVAAVRSGGNGLFASADRSGQVKLWRLEGDQLRELLTLRHPRPVRDLRFLADGVTLYVLVEGEYALRVYHLAELRARLKAMGLGGLEAVTPLTLPKKTTAPAPAKVKPAGTGGMRLEVWREGVQRGPSAVSYGRVPGHGYLGLAAPVSARWSGWLRAPKAGRYVLAVQGRNRVRLWLDGALMAETAEDLARVEVDLGSGPHEVVVEQTVWDGEGWVRLLWGQAGAGALEEVGPHLHHVKAAARKPAARPLHPVRTFEGLERADLVAFSADGKRVAAGDDRGEAGVWDVAGGERVRAVTVEGWDGMRWVGFSPTLLRALSVHKKTLRQWDLATAKPSSGGPQPRGGLQSAAYSPDSRLLAVGRDPAHIAVYPRGSAEALWENDADGQVRHLLWKADGSELVSVEARRVRWWAWDGEQAAPSHAVELPDDLPDARHGQLSKDGRTLLLGCRKPNALTIAVVRGGKVVARWPGPRMVRGRFDLALSPDGRLAAAAAVGGVRLYQTATGREVGWIEEEEGRVVCFSPSGQSLLVASARGGEAAKLWMIGALADAAKAADGGGGK